MSGAPFERDDSEHQSVWRDRLDNFWGTDFAQFVVFPVGCVVLLIICAIFFGGIALALVVKFWQLLIIGG